MGAPFAGTRPTDIPLINWGSRRQDADIQDERLQNEAVLKPESIANALGNLYSSLDELAWVVSPEALAIHSYFASEAIGTVWPTHAPGSHARLTQPRA